MTEEEWMTGDELWRMLRFLDDSGRLPPRKVVLYSVTACRCRGIDLPPEYAPILDEFESLAELAGLAEISSRLEVEGFIASDGRQWAPADSLVADRLLAMSRAAHVIFRRREGAILRPGESSSWGSDPRFDADYAVCYALMMNPYAASFGDGNGSIKHSPLEARILRDLIGNPFRSVALDPRWQSETVLALATGIYAERAFDRMPILADALEEAGCDNADILTHCRGNGPHVRGCWVVDLILGKQ